MYSSKVSESETELLLEPSFKRSRSTDDDISNAIDYSSESSLKNFYSQDLSHLNDTTQQDTAPSSTTTDTSALFANGNCDNFIFLNRTYPLNKAYQKLISTGFFFKNNKITLGIGVIKSGRQIIFTDNEWAYIQLNLNDIRIKNLLSNKIYSKKTELSNDLQISISFHFGEWRINLTRPSQYIRITLNRGEWETLESLIPLLNNHLNCLKPFEDDILRQISTGILSVEGTIFKQLAEELNVYNNEACSC